MNFGNIYTAQSLRRVLLLLMLLQGTFGAWSQCTNTSSYGSATINTSGAVVTISTCSFGGEYSTISGAVSGQTLKFTSSVSTDVITIHSGTSSGPIIAFGTTPLTYANGYTGTIYAHWNTPGCGSESACRTTTVQCTSCSAGPSPCTNTSSYGSATINTAGAVVTISTCSFAGEYSTISGAVAGQTLKFTSSVATDYITVHSGTSSGPVLANGTTPLTFSNTYTGTIYSHWNTPGCGSESACRTTTVQCTSCLVVDPCASITTLSCGASSTATLSGTGAWSPGNCGFSTPGQEKVHIFTAPTTGSYTLQVTSTSSTGYVDYFIKPVSDGCSATGWNCLSSVYSPTTISMGTLTAGTQYYILLDEETTSSITQSFQINCPTPSLSLTCPAPVTVTCASAVPPNNPASCIAITNCASGGISITFLSDVISSQTCANKYLITRTYRATDLCGNVSTCSQLITVNDNVSPTITTCPAAVTVSCASNVPGSNPALISATDNCAGTVTYSFVGDVISNQTCTNRYTVTRTYRATDVCGNSSTCAQIITVNDITAPTITCPATLNVSCANLVPAATPSSVITSDNCSGAVTASFVSDVISNQTCANRYSLTRTYRATDVCGNSSTCTQTINVNDQTVPVITGVPANITIPCNVVVPNPPIVTVTDNCAGGTPTLTYNQVSTKSPWSQLCEYYSYTITRTWVATDVCGNSTSKVQVITVQDNTPPSWVSTPPANITVQCNEDDVNNVDPIASDQCDPNPSILFSFYYIPYLNGCVNSYTVVNTWVAGDRCGNTRQFVQHIYVVDTEAPTIKCPANISIFSTVPIAVTWPLPTADDYCDGELVPVQTGGPHIGSMFLPGTATTITYTATDGCGNKSTCSFIVVIKNTLGKESEILNDPLYQNPDKTILFQNIPNPFESYTKINFSLPLDQEVTMRIYGIDGKLVKEISGDYYKGINEININDGDLPSSGMYFYEMRSNGFIETKKMFYVK